MVSINTNMTSLMVQRSLLKSTNALNSAIEQMTTGYKLNRSSDNAANYSISQLLSTRISSLDVAEENAKMGLDMVGTASSGLDLISKQAVRLRDLVEQSLNGTYGNKSIDAMNAEALSIIDEIKRLASEHEFNGIPIFRTADEEAALAESGADLSNIITLQVGISSGEESKIRFNAYFSIADIESIAENDINVSENLDILDAFLSRLQNRQVDFGSVENRLTSVLESISVKYNNLVSSRSTLRDADAGEISSEYIRQQILQQAAATLLSTTNQSPAIALQLL